MTCDRTLLKVSLKQDEATGAVSVVLSHSGQDEWRLTHIRCPSRVSAVLEGLARAFDPAPSTPACKFYRNDMNAMTSDASNVFTSLATLIVIYKLHGKIIGESNDQQKSEENISHFNRIWSNRDSCTR